MKTNLCIADPATFWGFRSWAQFARMHDKAEMVAIIPVVGIAHWSDDLPLDFEETLSMSLLKSALEVIADPLRFIVLPPARFNLGRKGQSFFTVDPACAHASLRAIVANLRDYGFRKILLLNSSPWNVDLVDSAGRDLRIELGVQPFCINLSSMDLDFGDPVNLPKLHGLASLLMSNESAASDPGDADDTFATAATRMANLLNEVHAFRPLPNDGAIADPTAWLDIGT